MTPNPLFRISARVKDGNDDDGVVFYKVIDCVREPAHEQLSNVIKDDGVALRIVAYTFNGFLDAKIEISAKSRSL